MKISEQLIENVVRDVILEYGGVSDDIMHLSYVIFNEILNQQSNYASNCISDLNFKGTNIFYKEFNLEFNKKSEIAYVANEVKVQVFIYNDQIVSYDEIYGFLNENHLIKLSFAPYKRIIKLTLVLPNSGNIGSDIRYDSLSSINHEVKHAYQYAKYNNSNNPNVQQAYTKALKELGSFGDDESPLKQLVTYYIPWIYYKLDKEEIDAWMQEMYIQATDDIRNTKTYKSLIDVIEKYNQLKSWYTSNEFYYTSQNIKEYIDKSIRRLDTPRNYFKVCDRNVLYLKRKMRRVIGRWDEEMMNNHGSFKQYSQNEIPMGSPFIQNRRNIKNKKYSMLRNLFNKFFNRKNR